MNSKFYESLKKFQEFADGEDVEYKDFMDSLRGFNKGLNSIREREIDPDTRKFLISKLIESKQNSLLIRKIKESHPFVVYDFVKEFSDIEKSAKKYVQREHSNIREETLNSLESLPLIESLDLIKRYNEFAQFAEFDLIHPSELKLKDSFKFGLHPDLDLKEGDLGKCIIYIDNQQDFVGFNVSKVHYFTLKDTSESSLREFFNEKSLDYEAGAHKSIERPNNSRVQGGGVFFVKDRKVYVARESGDFYEMNKSLLEKCFEDTEFKLDLSFAKLCNAVLKKS